MKKRGDSKLCISECKELNICKNKKFLIILFFILISFSYFIIIQEVNSEDTFGQPPMVPVIRPSKVCPPDTSNVLLGKCDDNFRKIIDPTQTKMPCGTWFGTDPKTKEITEKTPCGKCPEGFQCVNTNNKIVNDLKTEGGFCECQTTQQDSPLKPGFSISALPACEQEIIDKCKEKLNLPCTRTEEVVQNRILIYESTPNFKVQSYSKIDVCKYARFLEYRLCIASMKWLGQETTIPSPPAPIPVIIEIGTSFNGIYYAHLATGGTYFNAKTLLPQRMYLKAVPEEEQELFSSTIPHEIQHIVSYLFFNKNLPFWIDEGISITSEELSERKCKIFNDFATGAYNFFELSSPKDYISFNRAITYDEREKINLADTSKTNKKELKQIETLAEKVSIQGSSMVDYLLYLGSENGNPFKMCESRRKLMDTIKKAMDNGGTLQTWQNALKDYGFANIQDFENKWKFDLNNRQLGPGNSINEKINNGDNPCSKLKKTTLINNCPSNTKKIQLAYSDVITVQGDKRLGDMNEVVSFVESYYKTVSKEMGLTATQKKVIISIEYSDDDITAFTWMKDISKRIAHRIWIIGNKNNLYDILKHEIIHTALRDEFEKIEPNGDISTSFPAWAEEGLASQIDTPKNLKYRKDEVLDWINKNSIPKIDLNFLNLENIPPTDTYAYTKADYLTKYFLSLGDKPTFVKFAAEGKAKGWDYALQKYYGIQNINQLQINWEVWLKSYVK